jgi:hypothetical protein
MDGEAERLSVFSWKRRTFTNHHARGHCVASRQARHDGAVSNTKVVDSIDFELTIYDRHGISSHLGSARLVVISCGCITDEVIELRTFQLPGITSRLVKGRSAAELPISRQSSTEAIAAFKSSG